MAEAMILSIGAQGAQEAGDPAVEHLLELGAPAYLVAVRVLRSEKDAEDVVQQAYLAALAGLRRGTPPENLRAWFLGVVANTARDHVKLDARQRRREAAAMAGREKTTGTPLGAGDELVPALRRELNELDEKYRLPVALCCEQGLSQREAALILDLPERTVSKYVSVGLDRLRESLRKAGYAAAPAALIGSLAHTAPPVPATLAAALEKLVSETAVRGTAGAAATTVAAKGGLAMKIVLGVVGAGVLAGAVTLVSNVGAQHAAPLQSPPAPQPAEDRMVPVAFIAGTNAVQDGPARSAVVNWHSIWRMAPNGDVFVLDPAMRQIFVYVEKEGRVYTLCTGALGCLDGPAGQAQVAMQFGDRTYPGICCDAEGRMYFSDNLNGRLRMAARGADGRWGITTLAGAGSRKPESVKPGETVPAGELGAMGNMALAAAADGTVYLGVSWVGIFTLKDGKLTRLKVDKPIYSPNNIGVTDAGDIFVMDGRNHYAKICKNGEVVFLGGYGSRPPYAPADWKPQQTPGKSDGPALEAGYWCPCILAVAPDGSAIYTGGGDDATIRRLKPATPEGRVSTLMADGTWQECDRQNQKSQWLIPPTVEQFPGQVTTDLRTGRVGLHKDDGFMLSRPPPRAWLNRPEGPQVAKLRKAFGFDEGR